MTKATIVSLCLCLMGFHCAVTSHGQGAPNSNESRTSQVAVVKRQFLDHDFGSAITDMRRVSYRGSNLLAVVSQTKLALFGSNNVMAREFPISNCHQARIAYLSPTNPIVFCPGDGVSAPYAMGFDGFQLWSFQSTETVYRAVQCPTGGFVLCMVNPLVLILTDAGTEARRIGEKWKDVCFDVQGRMLAIAVGNSRRLTLNRLDTNYNTKVSVPIDGDSRRIVAVDWPLQGDVVLATSRDLFVVTTNGNIKYRQPLPPGEHVSASSVILSKPADGTVLAVCAIRRLGQAGSSLVVLSSRFKVLHEEVLPVSRAISTLDSQNCFYVGMGASRIVEYSLP